MTYYPIPRCHCGRRSRFDAPEKFCNFHWSKWWGKSDPSGRMFREALALCAREDFEDYTTFPGIRYLGAPAWWLLDLFFVRKFRR